MDIRAISGVAVSILSLLTWKYYSQEHHQTACYTNALPKEHSQRTRMEFETVTTLKSETMEHEIMTEEDELQLQQCFSAEESRERHQKDALFLEFAPGELSSDQIIIILLIHIFGADLISAISTVLQIITSTGLLVELAFGYVIADHIVKKVKSEIEEVIRKNVEIKHDPVNTRTDQDQVAVTQMEVPTELQNQADSLEAVLLEAVSMQTEIKTELENQRDRVRERLEEVEREREFNKQRLQAVENEITEKEKTFEKPEKLVSDKENFLKDQWKLDETKRDCERQLLNLDKLLEPIEGQIAWLKRKQGAGQV